MPVVDLFEKQGKLKKIDAMKNRDAVYADVVNTFKDYI